MRYKSHLSLNSRLKYPLVRIKISIPCASIEPLYTSALLDTGASNTCFPSTLVTDHCKKNDYSLPYTETKIGGVNGEFNTIAAFLALSYGRYNFEGDIVLLKKLDIALIGRDILDKNHIFFNGKEQVWGYT